MSSSALPFTYVLVDETNGERIHPSDPRCTQPGTYQVQSNSMLVFVSSVSVAGLLRYMAKTPRFTDKHYVIRTYHIAHVVSDDGDTA